MNSRVVPFSEPLILSVKSRRQNCGTIGGKADASKKIIDRRSDLYYLWYTLLRTSMLPSLPDWLAGRTW